MYNIANRLMRPGHAVLPAQLLRACITPDALCFIAIYFQTETGNGGDTINENGTYSLSESMSISIYVLDDSFTLLKRLPLKSMIRSNVRDFHVECKLFGPQLHLVFLLLGVQSYVLMSQIIEVSSAQQKCQVRHIDAGGESSVGVSEKNIGIRNNGSLAALNYIFHAFDKYAISSPLCPEDRDLTFLFLLCPPFHEWNFVAAKKNCKSLVKTLIRDLEGKGKFFEGLNLELIYKVFSGHCPFEEIISSQRQSIAGWIRKLLCLVPLQVARAENNIMRVMIDGLEIPPNVDFSDAVSLASVLQFGTYDLLLEPWKGKIKVVSSMGKQSSGKSYLLNHLAGSLLDVAGGRCTDGVWMTVRWDSECMYVLLDFEGLGSFERNDQEDMLLSTLSAAVSNVTIFNKKDFHMDKETEAIFQRFQHGVTLVKADDKLFKGVFFIAVKDVDNADVEDLKVEFYEKIRTMCTRTNENFLLRMYDGQVCIYALPPFQRYEFNRSIEMLASGIREVPTQYKNGRSFLQDFKLVLAQISAQDWSSVDSRRVMMRISMLRTHLQSAITLGQCNDGEMLANLDNDDSIQDDPMYSESEMCGSLQLQDSGLKLAVSQTGEGVSGMDDIVESLRSKFLAAIPRVDRSEKEWHAAYQSFLSSLMVRRQRRVLEWLRVNTIDFKEDGDVQQLLLEVSSKLAELKNKVLLCSCKCSKCFLTCVLRKGHHSDHSCLGTHICSQKCTFCQEEQAMYLNNAETALIVVKYADVAGHSGRHDCNIRMHTCQKDFIKYGRASNCNKKCSLRVSHLGEHCCNSLRHMCREECSLPGCENACTVAFDSEHKRHECHEQFCSVQCSMPGCMRQCSTKNHFHSLEADAQHFCSNEHPCAGVCEAPGVCNVVTELLRQTRHFHGKRGDFEYDFVSEQSEDRKGCCLMIPSFTREHSGPHVHSTNTNVVHYCNIRCPDCDYYCQLPYGHAGSHNTVHGNMKKTKFVAEMEDIDFQDRKYVRGESGVAEMCAMHCRARGRGHTHLIPCPEIGVDGCCTGKLYDGARHLSKEKCKLLGVNTPLDEMTHDTYWEYISFVDPCEEDEREIFALCNHIAKGDIHTFWIRRLCD
ncbi:hypothetical protein KP509_35G015100 [Ceratopteris richardii]|uniref:Guanylate-binding protein N-terminal domain-containing protein n=1 Tax=Ceratopteris richardii TaxID=49495 RepID=A0A8T2QFE5_CERRI|nr:hypothetical protein KP509_35G015100 [Ceratopteris richardii]